MEDVDRRDPQLMLEERLSDFLDSHRPLELPEMKYKSLVKLKRKISGLLGRGSKTKDGIMAIFMGNGLAGVSDQGYEDSEEIFNFLLDNPIPIRNYPGIGFTGQVTEYFVLKKVLSRGGIKYRAEILKKAE